MHTPNKYCSRRPQWLPPVISPRTRTVAILVAKWTRQHGAPPADADIAKILAISPHRVALHRRLLALEAKR